MNFSRKITFLVCICTSLSWSINAQTTLRLKASDKSFTSFELNNIRKLSFETSDHVTITETNGLASKLSLISYNYFDFTLSSLLNIQQETNVSAEIFPNPVETNLHIRLSNQVDEKITIEIFTLNGDIIYRNIVLGNLREYEVNLSGIRTGILICKISAGSTSISSKIIKK